MPYTEYKRRKYIVYRHYQIKYALVILIAMAVLWVAISLTTYWATFPLLKDELSGALTYSQTAEIANALCRSYSFRAGLLLIIFALLGIYLSHKVVGPIPRLKQALKRMSHGEYGEPVIVRRGDELKDLSKTINEMMEQMKEQHEQESRIVQSIERELLEWRQTQTRQHNLPPELLSRHLQKIEQLIGEIETLRQESPDKTEKN
jgi:nitrate/nitrite-specific signal transduction histidine kinase